MRHSLRRTSVVGQLPLETYTTKRTDVIPGIDVRADLKKIGLVERRPSFAVVASCPRNNSQTIHCGDIETNYTLQKAKIVKRQADMLRNYATKLPPPERDLVVQRMQKMALAVGETECEFMEKRFHLFRTIFTRMQFIDKKKVTCPFPWTQLTARRRCRRGLNPRFALTSCKRQRISLRFEVWSSPSASCLC